MNYNFSFFNINNLFKFIVNKKTKSTYAHIEIEVLKTLAETSPQILHYNNLDLSTLLKDELIKETSRKFQNGINNPPKEYFITNKGRKIATKL